MTFATGMLLGIFVGANIGAIFMGIVAAGGRDLDPG